MTATTKRRVLSLAFILVAAGAFMAGKLWDEEFGSGQPAHSCGSGMAPSTSMEGCSMNMDHEAPAAAKEAATKPADAKPVDSYPLDTCPVTGKKLGSMGKPVIKNYEGREVRFCCAGCPAKFEKDLQANLKKLDAAIAQAKEAGNGKADVHAKAQRQPEAPQGAVPLAGHQDHAQMH